MYDPQVEQLSQRNWTPGRLYPTPAHIGNAPTADYGEPYHIAGWNMRRMTLNQYNAPPVGQKTNQVYPIGKNMPGAIDKTPGAAPQSGIYTGIPSGCSAGGIGSPHS